MLSKVQVIFSEVPNHTTRTTWRQQLPSRRIQRRAHRNFYPLESSIPSTTLPSCCHALTGTFSLLPTWTETTRQERSMMPSQPHFHLQTRTTDLWLWYTTKWQGASLQSPQTIHRRYRKQTDRENHPCMNHQWLEQILWLSEVRIMHIAASAEKTVCLNSSLLKLAVFDGACTIEHGIKLSVILGCNTASHF